MLRQRVHKQPNMYAKLLQMLVAIIEGESGEDFTTVGAMAQECYYDGEITMDEHSHIKSLMDGYI